jgi:acyl carrier protein
MESVAERVTNIVAILSGFKPADVKPEDELEGRLGMDSLDKIEMVMAVEEEFEFEVKDEDAEACVTVADVVALVERVSGVGK